MLIHKWEDEPQASMSEKYHFSESNQVCNHIIDKQCNIAMGFLQTTFMWTTSYRTIHIIQNIKYRQKGYNMYLQRCY